MSFGNSPNHFNLNNLHFKMHFKYYLQMSSTRLLHFGDTYFIKFDNFHIFVFVLEAKMQITNSRVHPYKTLKQPTKPRCAMWCQQEVDCATFAARPLHTRSVKCLMHDSRPQTFYHQPEDGAVTTLLMKTVYA